MEDSYTVHRRRKAAARRREKTPEPSCTASLQAQDDREQLEVEESGATMEEDEERRARMERMVEDTERMELQEERSRSRPRQLKPEEPPPVAKARSRSPAARAEVVPREEETKATRKTESPVKNREPQEEAPSRELRKRLGSPEESKTRTVRRSPSVKKQIIPLSDNSLYEDVAKAKHAYSHRESIDDYEYEEDDEEEYVPRRRRETNVRRRKTSVMHTDNEKEEISKAMKPTSSWFSWIPFFGRKTDSAEEEKNEKEDEEVKKEQKKKEKKKEKVDKEEQLPNKATFGEFFKSMFHIISEFNEFCRQNPSEVQVIVELRNLCIIETMVSLIICGLGGLAFRFTEGAFESFYKCGVKRVKRDFIDNLWSFSHSLREDDWKSLARRKLMDFEEQLHEAHEAGVQTYSGQRSWTFLNACMYCLTVISTIGYGHISPSTNTGKAITIAYAIIGIPLFLIVITDFGKLFTRAIKFFLAFIRRLYNNGSCHKEQTTRGTSPEKPCEIDDEFNLPVTLAIAILGLYSLAGAVVFNFIEDWSLFESFYFIFISTSTIGFGDFVPQDPLYMMLSIVYMTFGLALCSMCLGVIQGALSNIFNSMNQKIGATLGFHVTMDGTVAIEIDESNKEL